jgi:molybdopterin converting factor small subunit
MRVNFFGMLAEMVGEQELYLPEMENTDLLQDFLYLHYPMLKEVNYKLAVNHKIIFGTAILQSGDEIALMPPFSGG